MAPRLPLLLACLSLSGCASISFWPFHKPAPLTVVSKTELQLNDVNAKLTALEAQLTASRSAVQQDDHFEWLYVSRMVYSLDYSLQAHSGDPVQRLLVSDVRRVTDAKAPLVAQDLASGKALVDGLYSPLQIELDKARAQLADANSKVTAALHDEVEKSKAVVSLSQTVEGLQTQQGLLSVKLSDATKAAVKADDTKNQALATWHSIKLYFWIGASILVLGFIASHLHIASVAKALLP